MPKFNNFDYLYAVFMVIFGIVMFFSPRSVMRHAKYDEEGIKTENMVKKLGIGLAIFGIAFGIFIYYKMNHA